MDETRSATKNEIGFDVETVIEPGMRQKKEGRKMRHERSKEKHRVTAFLGRGCQITVVDSDLTLERFIELLDALVTKARKARPRGITLDTFLRILRDQAKGTENGK